MEELKKVLAQGERSHHVDPAIAKELGAVTEDVVSTEPVRTHPQRTSFGSMGTRKHGAPLHGHSIYPKGVRPHADFLVRNRR